MSDIRECFVRGFFKPTGSENKKFAHIIVRPVNLSIDSKNAVMYREHTQKPIPIDKPEFFYNEKVENLEALLKEKAQIALKSWVIWYLCLIGCEKQILVTPIHRYIKCFLKKSFNLSAPLNTAQGLSDFTQAIEAVLAQKEQAINEGFERFQKINLAIGENPLAQLKAIDTSLSFFDVAQKIYTLIGYNDVPDFIRNIAFNFMARNAKKHRDKTKDWAYFIDIANKKGF